MPKSRISSENCKVVGLLGLMTLPLLNKIIVSIQNGKTVDNRLELLAWQSPVLVRQKSTKNQSERSLQSLQNNCTILTGSWL
jgi:hypothetical protein